MPDFWFDANSLICAQRGPYGFDIAPGFWDFLEQKGKEDIIASSIAVYKELEEGGKDDLLVQWARKQKDNGFFIEPDLAVQTIFRQIADYVSSSYPPYNASEFLDNADPWLIAHAKVYGGIVVTFEVSAPNSKDPKIPNVGDKFGVLTLDLYQLLRELGVSLH
ncbi:hypothetical protein ES702_04274 [subsurface metagenome]